MSMVNMIRKNKAVEIAASESLQIEMIRAWLHKIGETESDHHLVLNKCWNDPMPV